MREILDDFVLDECSKSKSGLELYNKCMSNPHYTSGKVDDKKYSVGIVKSVMLPSTKSLEVLFSNFYNTNQFCTEGHDDASITYEDKTIRASPAVIKGLKFLLLLQINKCTKFSEVVYDVFITLLKQVLSDSSNFVVSYKDSDKFSKYVKTEIVEFLSKNDFPVKLVKEVVHD